MSNEKDQKEGSSVHSGKREIEIYSSKLISRGLELVKAIEQRQKEGVVYGDLSSEVIEALKQAIRINPDYAVAHFNLGLTYDELGRYNEAIEAYKQAIKINPDDSSTHKSLGVVYYKLNRYREAVEAFKMAIQIMPSDADAHYGLGLVYLKVKDKSMAIKQHKILKNLDVEKADELFKEIYE